MTPATVAEIALQREATFRGLAKEQQGMRTDLLPTLAESLAPIDTREEVSKIAQTSHGSYAKAKTIIEKANQEQKEKVRAGETTINKAYQDIKRTGCPTIAVRQ